MKLKERVRQGWRSLEMLAYPFESDEQTDLRSRLERLERQVANLKKAKP